MLSVVVLLASSCASIVSKSSYPISINSVPSAATITVTDKKGVEIYKGATPATMNLKSGAGFFTKASYQVKFQLDGYEERIVPINFKLDGWYFGNVVFGGFIGLLIVDPATGAMYKLDTEYLNETLTKSVTAGVEDNEQLRIFGINEIPDSWKDHMVALD